MNKTQRIILIIVTIVIFLMLLFPPFLVTGPLGITYNWGYSFILYPPSYKVPNVNNTYYSIMDIKRLLVQWVGVLIIGGILWILFKGRK